MSEVVILYGEVPIVLHEWDLGRGRGLIREGRGRIEGSKEEGS